MSVINVTSEIKPLKKVLLHRPGEELLNLTPDNLHELLFDDIPFLKVAQEEHDYFSKVLRENGAETVYLEDLMTETLSSNISLKEEFLEIYLNEAGSFNKEYKTEILNYLNSISSLKELVFKTMSGININELDLSRKTLSDYIDLSNSKMIINPMPNLFFTRDPFASIGSDVSINKMYSNTRNRETIYADFILKYHPSYKDKINTLYDRNSNFSIEGGDILNIDENTLAIGISQRTEANAIELLSRNIFFNSNSKIKEIYAFEIPSKRAFMHLDTVFTQVDVDKFTIHPEILGTLRVFKISKGIKDLKIEEINDSLENILTKIVGYKIELILCGGGDNIISQREQWNDGSNTLCISPGKIIVYERNNITNDILRKKGLEVLEIPSSELSRGRGGPRCMTMPLIREDI